METTCGADWQLFTSVLEGFSVNAGPTARRQRVDSFLTATQKISSVFIFGNFCVNVSILVC